MKSNKISILILIICSNYSAFAQVELYTYNNGYKTSGYISSDAIYDKNGKFKAKVFDDGSVYNVNGKLAGWYQNGILYDKNGYIVSESYKSNNLIIRDANIIPLFDFPKSVIKNELGIKPVFKSILSDSRNNYFETGNKVINEMPKAISYSSGFKNKNNNTNENIVDNDEYFINNSSSYELPKAVVYDNSIATLLETYRINNSNANKKNIYNKNEESAILDKTYSQLNPRELFNSCEPEVYFEVIKDVELWVKNAKITNAKMSEIEQLLIVQEYVSSIIIWSNEIFRMKKNIEMSFNFRNTDSNINLEKWRKLTLKNALYNERGKLRNIQELDFNKKWKDYTLEKFYSQIIN